jgi:error-prone DNA polymerase
VDDAKLHGVEVLPVHPNESRWECTLQGGKVRLGWNMVKGLRRAEADALLEAQPFLSLADFLRRAPARRDLLLRLAMGDTFAPFGLSPRDSLWEVLELQRRTQPIQGDLFRDTEYEKSRSSTASFPPLGELTAIQEQYNAFSLSTRGHPMVALRKMLRLPKLNTQTAKQLKNGSHLTVAGLILVRQKPPTAKNMTFSTLEDEFGFLDMAIAPNVYERVQSVFLENCFLEVRGKIQRDSNSYSLWVLDLRPIFREARPTDLFIEPAQYFHSI